MRDEGRLGNLGVDVAARVDGRRDDRAATIDAFVVVIIEDVDGRDGAEHGDDDARRGTTAERAPHSSPPSPPGGWKRFGGGCRRARREARRPCRDNRRRRRRSHRGDGAERS